MDDHTDHAGGHVMRALERHEDRSERRYKNLEHSIKKGHEKMSNTNLDIHSGLGGQGGVGAAIGGFLGAALGRGGFGGFGGGWGGCYGGGAAAAVVEGNHVVEELTQINVLQSVGELGAKIGETAAQTQMAIYTSSMQGQAANAASFSRLELQAAANTQAIITAVKDSQYALASKIDADTIAELRERGRTADFNLTITQNNNQTATALAAAVAGINQQLSGLAMCQAVHGNQIAEARNGILNIGGTVTANQAANPINVK